MTLAALIPSATGELPYLYREVDGSPITWWDPLELVSEIEAWLVPASGNVICVNQLLSFVSVLGPDDQVRLGLPWLEKLVVANPGRIAGGAFALTTWLIEMRSVAVDAGSRPLGSVSSMTWLSQEPRDLRPIRNSLAEDVVPTG